MSIIDIKNLTFGYDKNKVVLDNISCEFQSNHIIAILGKNGSGKSTLLNCLLGYNNNISGSIEIDGKRINVYSEKELAKIIAYIPQNVQSNFDFTVREFVSFGRNPYISMLGKLSSSDNKIIDNCITECELNELSSKEISKISGGERQLVYIARALAQESKIIIMDEPTSALDFGNQQKLFKLIGKLKNKGKTIIFTTHNPNHLINLSCDIYTIVNRKIKRINKIDENTLKEIYGCSFLKEGETFIFDLKE